ncbi:anosmin-1 isoform X2 [Galleria mellonella]|nr:anosmin-1 isoform X2 [Galleria mellonella]XP_031763205.2 anosmin-1 isoform X2 [Galleria mellonella]XP_031763208.2 anosmin-1 isoform X2 [Galleria mellonella]XP_031763209.2 anosmin-1 isoform X2 [Galleria mellonella]XP_031763211.2 anosmin-1 isoform X2 [Galleria mellonella]XP_031763214.2 anosmin-1 isoform X2 [Galleria mellonella]XP_031763216.2 anosmin-1 isoform X2 [Galleria mellonella]XP_031763218.2 anosmin-1 isoform X2 [Galleria mellonella]XP_031763220.2 anosmin-1 isoform X2 [Galleria mello
MTFKMQVKILVVMVFLLMVPMVFSRDFDGWLMRMLSKHQSNSLSKARCDLMCLDVNKETKSKCRSQCRHKQKPGTCPVTDTPKWEDACVEACNSDSQCDGTQRCCRHTCGSTCNEPIDLLTLSRLPPLPVMDKAKEKKRSVLVKWSDGVGDAARAVPEKILYLLEEQHHLGPKYEEARLGQWNLILRTNKTKASLRNLLKPGHWYRFRVAAVSAIGTRGFSEPSAPFTPRRGPRPLPPPKKLKVKPLKSENGTFTIRLEWKEPKSDLPVMRYKVFWSRRARGVGGELDSLLVNHQTVSKDQTSIDIKDLQANSMYFLQVQAISQFGLGKLRSDKAAVFYNTPGSNVNQKQDSPPQLLRKRDRKIKGLKLHKVLWNSNRLKAKISWDPVANNEERGKYYVYWRTQKCQNPKKLKKDFSATTEETTFEIYELDYQCSYIVNVNKLQRNKYPDSELIVTVPSCEYFKQKVNNGTRFNCDT